MRKNPFMALLAATVLSLVLPVPAHSQLTRLKPALEERIARHKGTVGLAIIDLASGEKLSIRGDEPVSTASVIKLPILVELFHQVENGPLDLSDPVTMLAADQR